MGRKLVAVLAALFLLAACGTSPESNALEAAPELPPVIYPYLDLQSITLDISVEYCSVFLNTYENELLDFIKLFEELSDELHYFSIWMTILSS